MASHDAPEQNEISSGQHFNQDAPSTEGQPDMVSYYEEMQINKVELQERLEGLRLKLRESEETRERQSQGLLQSQMRVEQVSLSYDAEIKGRNQLSAKVQQTLRFCKILQEHCKILTDAFNRIAFARNELETSLNMKKSRSEELETTLEKFNFDQKIISDFRTKLMEKRKELEEEITAIREKLDQTQSENQALIMELKTQQMQKKQQLRDAQDLLSSTISQSQEREEEKCCLVQDLEEEIAKLEGKLSCIYKLTEDIGKELQDIKDQSPDLEAAIQEKLQIAAELPTVTEITVTLAEENEKLEEEFRAFCKYAADREDHFKADVEKLTSEKMNLDSAIKAIRNEIESAKHQAEDNTAELQTELLALQRLGEDLEKQVDVMSEQNRTLQHEIQQKVREHQLAEEEQVELKAVIQILRGDIQKLDVHLKDTKNKLESTLVAAQQEELLLNCQLDKAQEAMSSRMSDINAAKIKLNMLENSAFNVKEKVTELESTLSNLQIKYREEQEKEARQACAIDAQIESIKSLQSKVDTQKTFLDKLKERNKNVKQDLNKHIQDLRSKQQETQHELLTTQEIMQSCNIESSSLDSNVVNLKSSLLGKEAFVEKLMAELTVCSEEYSQQKKSSNILVTQTEENLKKLEFIKNNLAKTQAELEEKLSNARTSSASKTLELENLKRDIEKALKERQRIITEKESLIEEKRSAVEKLKTELDEKQVIQTEQTIKGGGKLKDLELLREELQSYKSQILQANEELFQREQDLHSLQESLTKEKEVSKEAATKILQLSTKIEMVERNKIKAAVDNEKRKEVVFRDLKKFQKTLEDRASEVRALNHELSEANKKLTHIQEEQNELKENIKSTENLISNVHTTLEENHPLLTHSEKEWKLLQSRIKHMEDEKAQVKKATEKFLKNRKAEKKKSLEESLEPKESGAVDNRRHATPDKQQEKLVEPFTLKSSENLTPRSILKPPKLPTPQQTRKTVSFTVDDDASSTSSVIVELEDTEEMERNPAAARSILERRRALHFAEKQKRKENSETRQLSQV